MTDNTVPPMDRKRRPASFLQKRRALRLDERQTPPIPAFNRAIDQYFLRPARRLRLRNTLAVSQALLTSGLTVLVPTRDRAADRLANLLASLERQTARHEMRIVVVDYGSGEGEAREVAQLAARSGAALVRVDADAWNRSAALNAGLRRVETKFVLVADVDFVFEPGYVEKALNLLREDPRRIVVSAMRDPPQLTPEAHSAVTFRELRSQTYPCFGAQYHPSIIATHRLAIAAAGGYDEGSQGSGLEDVDLFMRLSDAGLDTVDASNEAAYLHRSHPKYFGQTQANVAASDVHQLRLDGKRPVRIRQRKAIVTAAGPRMWHLLERYALPTFRRFADRFGYDVLVSRLDDEGNGEDQRRANAARWAKVGLMREAIETYDIAVWLDADVMICRFDDDIASHLAGDKFQAFVLEQVPEHQRINPNTGVWVVRSGLEGRFFLSAVQRAGAQRGPWADQATVMKILGWSLGGSVYWAAGPDLGSRFLRGTGWLPPSWNQFYTFPGQDTSSVHAVPRVEQPHALHFAGLRIADREDVMRQASERVMAARPDAKAALAHLGAELL